MTFEFLCAGLNFETSDLVTFWLSGGLLLRPSGLVIFCSYFVSLLRAKLLIGAFSVNLIELTETPPQDITFLITILKSIKRGS